MAEPKVVKAEEMEYEVEIKVTYRQKTVVDSNGRGYSGDYKDHTNVGTSLEVGFPAKSIDSVIKKSMAHLETLKVED